MSITNGVRGHAATENNHCPKFIAYAAEDSYVDSDDNLNDLINGILADNEMSHQDEYEDIVIWQDGCKIVAIITDNKVTRVRRRKS